MKEKYSQIHFVEGNKNIGKNKHNYNYIDWKWKIGIHRQSPIFSLVTKNIL